VQSLDPSNASLANRQSQVTEGINNAVGLTELRALLCNVKIVFISVLFGEKSLIYSGLGSVQLVCVSVELPLVIKSANCGHLVAHLTHLLE
jgi:hypothetical protein